MNPHHRRVFRETLRPVIFLSALLLIGCRSRESVAVTDTPDAAPAEKPPAAATEQRLANLRKSRANLRQIARALTPGTGVWIPAAMGAKRQLSWRVYLLQHFGEDGDRLFRQFKLDEPWDSPQNKKLLPLMPDVYAPVGDVKVEPGHTFYQVFNGPGALYSHPGEWVQMTSVTDGTMNTLLAVEAADAVPWTKPEDVRFDADPRKPLPKLGGLFEGGANACLCDGRVLFIPREAPDKVVRALITRAGGETIRLTELGLGAAEWGELLENGGAEVAHEALVELGPDAITAARPVLRRALDVPETRLIAADLLSRQKLDGKDAIPALVAALEDSDRTGWYLATHLGQPRHAARALGRYGAEAVPALIEALPAEGAVQGLGEVGPPAKEAVPRLVEMLAQEDAPGIKGALLRAWVIHALGRIGPDARPAAPALTRLLKSYARGADIRVSGMHVGPAVRALGAIGPGAKEAAPVLKALLESAPSARRTGGLPEDDVDIAAALLAVDPGNELALARLHEVCKPAQPPQPPLEVAKAAFALARRDPKDPEHRLRLTKVIRHVHPGLRSGPGSNPKEPGYVRAVQDWFAYQDEVFIADVARWLEH
jgi:hypothetical protein